MNPNKIYEEFDYAIDDTKINRRRVSYEPIHAVDDEIIRYRKIVWDDEEQK